MLKRQVMLFIVLLLSMDPVSGSAEESVPRSSFIEITEHVLEQFDALIDDARQGNFNQLKNPVIQARFDRIRTDLQEYEGYGAGSIRAWREGRQKDVAERLYAANFFYRAYALTQVDDYREKAETTLQKAREIYQEYSGSVKTNRK